MNKKLKAYKSNGIIFIVNKEENMLEKISKEYYKLIRDGINRKILTVLGNNNISISISNSDISYELMNVYLKDGSRGYIASYTDYSEGNKDGNIMEVIQEGELTKLKCNNIIRIFDKYNRIINYIHYKKGSDNELLLRYDYKYFEDTLIITDRIITDENGKTKVYEFNKDIIEIDIDKAIGSINEMNINRDRYINIFNKLDANIDKFKDLGERFGIEELNNILDTL